MTPELLLLLIGALGAGGLGARAWWQRGRRDVMTRVRADWLRAGMRIQYGPVLAVCTATVPRSTPRRGVSGVLGIGDDRLIFVGSRAPRRDLVIPIEHLRWIGVLPVPALIVHAETLDGWRAATFATDSARKLAQRLSEESGLPLHDLNERIEFGPARALRLVEDVYGGWQPDRTGDLYLAPDRLLFDWRHAIPLDTLNQLDIYPAGDRLRRLDLLRLDYTGDTGPQVIGFGVKHADRWAEAIARRTDAPLVLHAGRKKKR